MVKEITAVISMTLNAGNARRYLDKPLNSKISNSLSEDNIWKKYKIVQIREIGETCTKVAGMQRSINFAVKKRSRSKLVIEALKKSMTCTKVAVKVKDPTIIRNILRKIRVVYLE